MTGFGDAASQVDGVSYTIELRSLNNRYFKPTIRLPDPIAGLEAELESLLRKRLNRGSVTLTVSLRDDSASAAYEINFEAFKHYTDKFNQLKANLGEESDVEVDLSTLLTLPGVLQPPQASGIIEQARPVVTELVNTACDRLLAMREKEGQGIAKALNEYSKLIADRLELIIERAPVVVDEYHSRLQSRVETLMAKAQLEVNEPDLIREVAIYAERCDIAEEAQRLKAHLKQIGTIISHDKDEPAGRTLDFLSQELLREANTIASKSNDADINRMVVEIKGNIDRIKEQVQNIE